MKRSVLGPVIDAVLDRAKERLDDEVAERLDELREELTDFALENVALEVGADDEVDLTFRRKGVLLPWTVDFSGLSDDIDPSKEMKPERVQYGASYHMAGE